MALVLRTAAVEGARKALIAGSGIILGCLTWAAVIALGLGALLAASELAYAVLRWAGAAYLIWLGFKPIFHPRRSDDAAAPARPARGAMACFRQWFLTNILNPRVGVFYVSFLPQLIPADVSVAG